MASFLAQLLNWNLQGSLICTLQYHHPASLQKCCSYLLSSFPLTVFNFLPLATSSQRLTAISLVPALPWGLAIPAQLLFSRTSLIFFFLEEVLHRPSVISPPVLSRLGIVSPKPVATTLCPAASWRHRCSLDSCFNSSSLIPSILSLQISSFWSLIFAVSAQIPSPLFFFYSRILLNNPIAGNSYLLL